MDMPGASQMTVETEAPQPVQSEDTPVEQTKLEVLETRSLEPKRVIEAALFLSNKPLSFPELALLAKCKVKDIPSLVQTIAQDYQQRESALHISIENTSARLEVRPEFLSRVAPLSRNVELSRKASRMLALIASRGGMLQSELKRYFRGEIYAYARELKDHDYLVSEKKGNTRLLKPTKKFNENFQLAQPS